MIVASSIDGTGSITTNPGPVRRTHRIVAGLTVKSELATKLLNIKPGRPPDVDGLGGERLKRRSSLVKPIKMFDNTDQRTECEELRSSVTWEPASFGTLHSTDAKQRYLHAVNRSEILDVFRSVFTTGSSKTVAISSRDPTDTDIDVSVVFTTVEDDKVWSSCRVDGETVTIGMQKCWMTLRPTSASESLQRDGHVTRALYVALRMLSTSNPDKCRFYFSLDKIKTAYIDACDAANEINAGFEWIKIGAAAEKQMSAWLISSPVKVLHLQSAVICMSLAECYGPRPRETPVYVTCHVKKEVPVGFSGRFCFRQFYNRLSEEEGTFWSQCDVMQKICEMRFYLGECKSLDGAAMAKIPDGSGYAAKELQCCTLPFGVLSVSGPINLKENDNEKNLFSKNCFVTLFTDRSQNVS